MDTALRRRFEFVEKMPESDNIEPKEVKHENGTTIDLRLILTKINERIEYLYDRDHTIGHAYLMGVNSYHELCHAFANKIIPLLQEYFYEDWGKVQAVLNCCGEKQWEANDVLIQSQEMTLDVKGYDDDGDKKIRYRVNPKLITGEIDPKAFTRIYE